MVFTNNCEIITTIFIFCTFKATIVVIAFREDTFVICEYVFQMCINKDFKSNSVLMYTMVHLKLFYKYYCLANRL